MRHQKDTQATGSAQLAVDALSWHFETCELGTKTKRPLKVQALKLRQSTRLAAAK
jgi:hypothetical protein